MKRSGKTIAVKHSAISNIYERAAKDFLLKQGLVSVTDNYRCRAGEIDLVMRDRDTLVFVEVRFRKNRLFGGGAASVTRSKQKRLIRAARYYLQREHYTGNCRFDVVDVTYALQPGRQKPERPTATPSPGLQFQWLENAFQTD